MVREEKSIFNNIDKITLSIYVLLVIIGWFNIYAAVYNDEHKSIFDLTQNYGKQMIFILSSFVIATAILIIDAKFFNAFSYPIYFLVILILVAVLLAGTEISGSKSWFQIGAFSIQPAEFAKFSTALALARYLGKLDTDFSLNKTKVIIGSILLLPALLIFFQNDTGSAIVFTAFILVLYREGLSGNILVIGVAVAIIFIMALLINKYIMVALVGVTFIILLMLIKRNLRNILKGTGLFIAAVAFIYSVDYAFDKMLEPYQKKRIDVLLGKETDLKGAGYNVNQSKIAIGSGGLIGKGFLQGTQTKYNFVPEQSTDFIFCTIGEEWGFTGSIVVISLYIGLLIRLVNMAERQRSAFSRIYGYSVASIIFFHFVVNIGMTIGVLPVIGIPLPFLSYGGSSLWGFTVLLFIFIKQDANRLEIL